MGNVLSQGYGDIYQRYSLAGLNMKVIMVNIVHKDIN